MNPPSYLEKKLVLFTSVQNYFKQVAKATFYPFSNWDISFAFYALPKISENTSYSIQLYFVRFQIKQPKHQLDNQLIDSQSLKQLRKISMQ